MSTHVRRYSKNPLLGAPYGAEAVDAWRLKFIDTLKAQGFRICGKVCARKHHKRGRYVIPLGNGRFAWKGRSWSINTWLVADPRVPIVEKGSCIVDLKSINIVRLKHGEVP